jgi:hypothetical protein
MSSSSSVGRTLFQGVVVIASILLAFSANAWWVDRTTEIESLELVLRDLGDTTDQLQSFSTYSAGAGYSALAAYGALSKRAPYDKNTIRSHLLRVNRSTLQLPMAGYSDLLNSGDLKTIGNGNLRDSLVGFYESAERRQAIIENNNSVYIDGQLIPALFERGLILPHFNGNAGDEISNQANGSINNRLGASFSHRPDPIWNFPIDSREWRTLRSTLLTSAQVHAVGEYFANEMILEAQRLEDAIVIYLNER